MNMPSNDSMLDIYLYENVQLLEKFESLLLKCDKKESFSGEDIAELFRILHTLKGSSAMMSFDNIATLSHALEDLFGYMREHQTRKSDYRKISDLSLETLDTVKAEFAKLQDSALPDGDLSGLISRIKEFYTMLVERKPGKAEEEDESRFAVHGNVPGADGLHFYKAVVVFEKECKMENIRAFGIVKAVENLCTEIITVPSDLFADHSEDEIVSGGFTIYMASAETKETLSEKIGEAFFIQSMKLEEMSEEEALQIFKPQSDVQESETKQETYVKMTDTTIKQNYMSVNLRKLDTLMDLVGEIVITESTVTKNPEVQKLKLDSFEKASRQLRKLTNELQDIVMSIRMVPVSATFHKMERIVRDMSAKVGKNANLVIVGEDTEIDKNVLDNLSDPLMHIVRNSMDHGIETPEERKRLGKDPTGEIKLEARNAGGDVVIIISDDGRGLDKEQLIRKGIEKGLITKPASEVTDKEAYSLIFKSGFSTKEQVTEFSGRGVGMDVALRNIANIGGALSVDSTPGKGMNVQIRIPLTLAIIEGMQVSVGGTSFIIPLLSIKESFKPGGGEVFTDPENNEMIYIRGNCYPVLRLHKIFGLNTDIVNPEDGILVIVESHAQTYCLLVDRLDGEHQTVVKPMPHYISKLAGGLKSIAGCTILGDGSTCLIINVNGLF